MNSGSQPTKQKNKHEIRLWRVQNQQVSPHLDYVSVEEPLEIRLVNPPRTLALTMRTPGADFDLVTGFLLTEGILHSGQDVKRLSYCVDPGLDGDQQENIVNVELTTQDLPELWKLERHFIVNSACGVCGKLHLDHLRLRGYQPLSITYQISPDLITQLPEQLQKAQKQFFSTGGLHAAALFTADGRLQWLREDVGRHNALDKVIGAACLADQIPLSQSILMVSGRTSYEILQKSLAAGIPMICAVSAPSSLAVQLANEFGLTLIGFLRGDRFNIYAGHERVIGLEGNI
ncbi:MAG: formate dehydrogenase accessory sulfurtransferase FdhD [Cyanobacteriota bacterium]|nr:formate dehydrogenase accessory sulfurtransferase FdhD [Cyanobacteriota bacterium]